MQGLTSRLKNKIALYGKVPVRNELGEDDFRFDFIKNVYGEIIPTGGSNAPTEGDTTQATTSHKITIRTGSIDQLTNDMYFVFKNQRYDIEYFNPNYKYRDSIEILVKLIGGIYKHE